jgi:hypothetical protein
MTDRQYNESHSWQYDIRLRNRHADLQDAGLTESDVENLHVTNFRFTPLIREDSRQQAIQFIKRHEWLGNISQYTTHWFGAYYQPSPDIFCRPILAGVILMNMPNAFSTMLGADTPQLERLISRGACISWSPKCLASALLMWSIRWMVTHTQYRLFTAYADPAAKELGTIYQACNFYYLGKSAGTAVRCVNPYTGKMVNDRFFRYVRAYKQYAKELGIEWQNEWAQGQSMCWNVMPDDVVSALRERSRWHYAQASKVFVSPKHKYAMVLGRTSKETKRLRQLFESLNSNLPYPKNRGE